MTDKILIMHSGGIGDLLLALPAMRMFRAAFPRSGLELLGRTERLGLIAGDLGASSVHSIDQAAMGRLYSQEPDLPAGLSAFFSSFRAVLVFGKSSGPVLAQKLKPLGVETVTIPSFPSEGTIIHVAEFLIECLKGRGLRGTGDFSPLAVWKEAEDFGRQFWAARRLRGEERILAIHPGSGSPAKNWPAGNFAEVARWASRRARVLLVLGPAEDEVREPALSMAGMGAALADGLPLVQLAGALKSCSAYLGNDSGVTHLAAALGVPTVAVYGPTNPAVWRPWGPAVKVIAAMDAVGPGEPPAKAELPAGLERIDPRQVIQALEPLLGPGR